MKNNLTKTYKQFTHYKQNKQKQSLLKKFFRVFLPEAVYRNTKIERPEVSRKHIFSLLK